MTTLGAWWLHVRALRKSAAPRAKPERKTAKAGDARKAFVQACRHHDPLGAQRALLNWARQTDPAHPPSGLTAIAQRLNNPRVTELLPAPHRGVFAGGDGNRHHLGKTPR